MKHIFTLFALSTASALASPILGSWFINDETGPVVITFLPSNEFVFIQDGDTNIDPNGEDGMERGTWSWNPTTGALSTTVILDTNGEWGFSHGIAGLPGVTATVNANTLTVSIPGEGSFQLSRVTGTNPLTGAWFTTDGGQAGGLAVMTFLQNGTYFFAQDGDSAEDPNGFDGIERGTWSWNQTTGNLTTTSLTDTNGEWGLSHPGPTPKIFMLPLAQSFAYQDDIEIEEVILYKVRPISFNAWTSEQLLTGNNTLPTAKPFSDGVENILRYAMNLSPGSSPEQRPTAALQPSDPENFIFEYRRRIGLTGVNLIPQYSYDLVEWHDAPPASIQEIEPANPETATFRVTIPSPEQKAYGRLKAVATP